MSNRKRIENKCKELGLRVTSLTFKYERYRTFVDIGRYVIYILVLSNGDVLVSPLAKSADNSVDMLIDTLDRRYGK